MNISFACPLASRWQHIHADWWQDDQGNDIHRVEIDDDALYHCHLAGSSLPWDAVTTSLDEAMAVCGGCTQVDENGPPTPADWPLKQRR
ncbi:hypothetical protein [Halomonas sp. BM-2019]|uniref:hypothetical protein n=1 Tax=Halomonas sp. BM-2019 TaxID=2811227 RepID=UPI001B3C2C96|nr:MAG: hypothetical protein J5F18_05130 [Halomonas sp. BM-2019]